MINVNVKDTLVLFEKLEDGKDAIVDVTKP
jgi:hypothetical protein